MTILRAMAYLLIAALATSQGWAAPAPATTELVPTTGPDAFAFCVREPAAAVNGTTIQGQCPPVILLDRAHHATTGLFNRAFVGRDPVPLGETPLAYMQNPAPTVKDAVDVDLQRDERGLSGGEDGFIDSLQRNLCEGGKDVTSWVFCGTDILKNYSDHGENVARAAQATRLGAGPTWAMVAEAMDERNEGDPKTGLLAEEFDIRAAGGDAHRNRIDVLIVGSPPNGKPPTGTWQPTTVGYGIALMTIDNTTFDTAMRLDGNYHKGLDCSAAKITVGCVLMGDNQPLILSTDGKQQIKGNSAIIQASGTFGAGGGFQVNAATGVGFDCREATLGIGCLYALDGQPLVLSTQGTKQLSATDTGGFVFRDGAAGSLLTISSTAVAAVKPVKLPAYTVSRLPRCDSALQDAVVIVTDAVSPTYRGALRGGGGERTMAECDGSAWGAH